MVVGLVFGVGVQNNPDLFRGFWDKERTTPCRRCNRNMIVVANWDELSEERKADAICQDCYRTLMFNTSLG